MQKDGRRHCYDHFIIPHGPRLSWRRVPNPKHKDLTSMNYKVRTHPRARHVRLRVEPQGTVLITVPRGFDRSRLPALVAERRGWIEQVRQRLNEARPCAERAGFMPERIDLPALGERWTVHYSDNPSGRLRLVEHAGEQSLACHGQPAAPAVAELLRDWLKRRARATLVPRVSVLAAVHGFRPGKVTIRNQKSRWGSCSARGSLSLNARLLFLSPTACDSVLLHELVHTEHLDHSPAFWARLAEVDPACQRSKQELKSAWLALPDWVWV